MTAVATVEAPVARSLTARWDDLFERVGDLRAVAVLRIALGPVVLLHLVPFLRDARAGVQYDDHFWARYVSWAPRVPGSVWTALLWVGVAAAVGMTLGLLTRLATASAFVVVAGNLLLSQTHFRHNRAFLAILLFGLTLLPTGRTLSLDAWIRRRVRGRPARPSVGLIWPLMLLRVQVSLVYLASGISKLIDPDWVGGLVLWDRAVRYQYTLEPTPLPDWAIDFTTWRPLFWVVAPAAVATELFVGLGLWFRRTRDAAIWSAVVFHLSIEVSSSVEVFSYAAIAALAVWVTPSARDRVLLAPAGSLRLAARGLDWFGRFRLEPAPAGSTEPVVVDRDGTVYRGRPATWLVLRRLPFTFPIAAPLSFLDRWRPSRKAGSS